MDNHRRRRRKKPVDRCTRQDAELDQEVDDFLNDWSSEEHPRKRPWRYTYDYFNAGDGGGCGGVKGKDSLPAQTEVNGAVAAKQRHSNIDIKKKSSLPTLLRLREIGSTRFDQFGSRRSSTSATWKSRLLHQPYIASAESTTSAHQFYSLSSSQSQWNALQFSMPTYYGNYNNISSINEGAATTSSATGKGSIVPDNDHLLRFTWRPYSQRKIPFSKLRTPISDAILAIDRSGGYMIGIGSGDQDASGVHSMSKWSLPYLSIKFYGMPSPERVHRMQYGDCDELKSNTVSPLVHVVPLLSKKSCSIGNCITSPSPSSILDCNDYASPVAEIPIQILLINDGSMGVAFLRHSTVLAWSSNDAPTFSKSQDEETLGAIIIFATPIGSTCRNGSTMSKSFRLNNVSIGWWSSFTIRNALWPTTVIPVRDNIAKMTNSNCIDPDTFRQLFHRLRTVRSAYLLFNDEDDGFRITWITIDGNDDVPSCCSTSEIFTVTDASPNNIQPSRNDIVTWTEGDIWEECWSDLTTGCVVSDGKVIPCHDKGLNIACEVYLHIDALLSEIISRRQSSLFRNSPYHNERVFFMPDFFYNLVSASPDSLKVIVVIVFSNKEKMIMQSSQMRVPSALGVFVEVNLTDQSYNELKWVQHQSCNDASSMKQWCNSLALNWRMVECRVGVYCLEPNEIGQHMDSWVCGTHECNINEDLDDDRNVHLWRNYVDRRRVLKAQGLSAAPPKDISMSSLYPHCDVITNRAVHNAIPVKRMTSRDSATELIYGC